MNDFASIRAWHRAAAEAGVPLSALWSGEMLKSDPIVEAMIERGAMRPLSRGGRRTFCAVLDPGSTGSEDFYRFADGYAANIINCSLATPTRMRYDSDEPLLMFRASLACDCSYRVDGMAPMVFRRPEVAIAYVPVGQVLRIDVPGGSRQQGVVAFFRAIDFASRFNLRAEDLPPLLAAAVRGDADAGRIAGFPIDHKIASLIADLLDSPLTGEAKAVQVMGRVAELVALSLAAMQATPLLRSTSIVRRGDLDLAYAVRERLEAAYAEPPPFAELARQMGTNRNKLKVVFREAFGITMAEYCLERRVREAQGLLMEGKLSIGQIAERVGYEHQSSFAVAFRATTGMSPREYSKHRGPFSVPLVAAS